MLTLSSIPTPSLVVDLSKVRSNTEQMLIKARRSGILFRPHVKTHKTIEIALLQHGGERGPITVSTLAEAEFMAAGGFRDITYAVPIAPGKLERAADLARSIDRLNLLLDNVDTLGFVEQFGGANAVVFDVFLKVDCGSGRAGVDPRSDEALALGRALATSPSVRFRGLLAHAGHSYHARTRDEIAVVAAEETAAVSLLGSRLAGFQHDLARSIGSTPTACVVERFSDCEEVRPGNYVFYDAFQASIGACQWSDCAATVVATVIGVYPGERKAILDAGALALSKDPGPDHIEPQFGFGRVCDLDLRPLPMKITTLSQEHGKVVYRGAPPQIGDRLRIIPNHSCLTAALFDRYAVADGNEVVDEWRPVRGW